MRKPLDPAYRQDLLKLGCFVAALGAAGALFLGTPALTLPTICSIVVATLFSPWLAAFERRGLSRDTSMLLMFGGLVAGCGVMGWLIANNWQREWLSFQENAPGYFTRIVERLSGLEAKVKASHPFLRDLNLAAALSEKGNHLATWFGGKLPDIMSNLLGCFFLVPILTFCLLSEGRSIRRKFFMLVPNRFFESVYIVTHGVSSALSDYLRAKLIEASLVGALTIIGLSAIGSPYAIVLGIWSGATNILPYIGPPLGALPAILIAALDSQSGGAAGIWGTLAVFAAANLIDTIVIFPGIVAKLVKLNPLVLIASVVIGQYYYGILGMLISIPIAAAVKVVLYEVYVIIYGYTPEH